MIYNLRLPHACTHTPTRTAHTCYMKMEKEREILKVNGIEQRVVLMATLAVQRTETPAECLRTDGSR